MTASRIVTDALRFLAEGESDLDAAFERAVALHPCAPAARELARSIFVACTTRPAEVVRA